VQWQIADADRLVKSRPVGGLQRREAQWRSALRPSTLSIPTWSHVGPVGWTAAPHHERAAVGVPDSRRSDRARGTAEAKTAALTKPFRASASRRWPAWLRILARWTVLRSTEDVLPQRQPARENPPDGGVGAG